MRIRSIKPEFWRSKDIDPNDVQSFKVFGVSGPGREFIYLLQDKNGQSLYVGMTWNPFDRWRSHKAKHPWWNEVATAYLWICADGDARKFESEFIKKIRPIHNKHQNERWHRGGEDKNYQARILG